MAKKQTKVRVQQLKSGQFVITLPEIIAKQWLNVKKGDRVEFSPYQGKICIFKIGEDSV
jgi:co-chaperonin GroES (HSP10)